MSACVVADMILRIAAANIHYFIPGGNAAAQVDAFYIYCDSLLTIGFWTISSHYFSHGILPQV